MELNNSQSTTSNDNDTSSPRPPGLSPSGASKNNDATLQRSTSQTQAPHRQSSRTSRRPPNQLNTSYTSTRSKISNFPNPGTFAIRNPSYTSTFDSQIPQPLPGQPEQIPQITNPADSNNYVYVADGYRDLNPQYQARQDGPIWGLGRPFPRIVRPGMRKAGGTVERVPQMQQGSNVGPGAPSLSAGVGGGSMKHGMGQGPGSVRHDIGQGPGGGPAAWAESEQAYGHQKHAEGRTPGLEPGESKEFDYEPGSGGGATATENEEIHEYLNRWCKIRDRFREPLAEWLATTVMMFVGTCGNLQVTTSRGQAGNYLQEAWAWGFGVMLGIYIAGGISGGHINPLISIFLSFFRGFPAKRCLIYVCAQILGALCGCALAYAIYHDALLDFDPILAIDTSGTAFITMPKSFATLTTAFFNEFTACAVFAGTILALGDDSNAPPGAGMHAFIIGLDVTMLMMTLGWNAGPSLNPARDLAGRLVAWWVGYGSSVWARGWWALSWTATIFGGLMGGGLYDLVIFMGGESPVNYPKSQRKRKQIKGQMKFFRCFGMKQKARDLEEGVGGGKEVESRSTSEAGLRES